MNAFRRMILKCLFIQLSIPVYCVNTEKVHLSMTLDVDGILRNTSHIPSCGAEEKIDLLSYTYRQGDCPTAHACDEKPFSPEATAILHEMCSMKEACEGLRFPFRSELETVVIQLTYQCVDRYAPVIEMCDTADTTWNDSVHLISTNFAEFIECKCYVSSFATLKYNDVRLKAKDRSNCSLAEFLIDTERTSCIDVVEGYGSVFDKMVEEDMPIVFISLTRSGELEPPAAPEMIWLIIEPQESSEITCKGKRREVKTSTKATVVTSDSTTLTDDTARNYSVNPEYISGGNTGMSEWLIIIITVVPVATTVLVCGILVRRHLCAKRNTKPSLEKESDVQSVPLSSDKTSQPPGSLGIPIQETVPNAYPSDSKSYAPLRWYSKYTVGADLSGIDIDKVYDRVRMNVPFKRPANDPTYDHLLQPRKADASNYSNMLLTERSHHLERMQLFWSYLNKLLADTAIPSSRKAGTLSNSDTLLTDTVTPSSRIADRRYHTI